MTMQRDVLLLKIARWVGLELWKNNTQNFLDAFPPSGCFYKDGTVVTLCVSKYETMYTHNRTLMYVEFVWCSTYVYIMYTLLKPSTRFNYHMGFFLGIVILMQFYTYTISHTVIQYDC